MDMDRTTIAISKKAFRQLEFLCLKSKKNKYDFVGNLINEAFEKTPKTFEL